MHAVRLEVVERDVSLGPLPMAMPRTVTAVIAVAPPLPTVASVASPLVDPEEEDDPLAGTGLDYAEAMREIETVLSADNIAFLRRRALRNTSGEEAPSVSSIACSAPTRPSIVSSESSQSALTAGPSSQHRELGDRHTLPSDEHRTTGSQHITASTQKQSAEEDAHFDLTGARVLSEEACMALLVGEISGAPSSSMTHSAIAAAFLKDAVKCGFVVYPSTLTLPSHSLLQICEVRLCA